MGCDGGTIPTRDELVKLKKKPEQRDKDGHRLYKWQHCSISQQKLRKPVVACELGRLYNKESVIELLLNKDRSTAPANTEHIEKLKDVIELQLNDNPAFVDKQSVGDGLYNDALISPWICPVTGLEMNGRFKFVFCFANGKVVAERAIKVLRKDPAESQHYKEEDIVTINPEEEELDLMNSKMIARRARVKALKKAAKDAKRKYEAEFKVPSASKAAADPAGPSDAKKFKPEELSAFKDQKKTNDPSKIKSSKPKSVQDDPNASEVYKKLFSTHKTAQNQKKGNWVTFDPRYN